MKSRLYKKYQQEVVPQLAKELNRANKMSLPKLAKASLNVGINSRNTDSGYVEAAINTLARISGQKPVATKAKKAISAFKVREGMVVGVKVTLRGDRLYDFVDKLINISIPRIRDFRGLSEDHVDGQGNLTLGFKEHNVFPEIQSDEVEKIHGLEVSLATTAKSRAEGLALFKALGFPFKK